MLIVLEGCDGSGKSTIATNLSKLLDAEIIHCTKETPNTLEYFVGIVDDAKDHNIIADRFCYGQFVYQKPEERPLGTEIELGDLEEYMKSNGVKVILVDAPTDVIESRLLQRGETLINGLSVEEVRRRFKTLMDDSAFEHVFVWNTGGEYNDYEQL